MRIAVLFAVAVFFAGLCGALAGEHAEMRYIGPAYYAYPGHYDANVAAPAAEGPSLPTTAARRNMAAARIDRRHGTVYSLTLGGVPLLAAHALVPSVPTWLEQAAQFFIR